MLHINLHISYILFIKLTFDLKEFQVSNNYFEIYQENEMNLYFILNLHSNLNVKQMNIIEFFSMSCHIQSYHDSQCKP